MTIIKMCLLYTVAKTTFIQYEYFCVYSWLGCLHLRLPTYAPHKA